MNYMILFSVLIAFGACQALFISIIFLTQKSKSLPKSLFALFLIIEGLTLIERLLAETELINALPHLLGISYPLSFIKGPLLFLMAMAVVDNKFRLQKKHLLHAIPFLIVLISNLPFYFFSGEQKLEMVRSFLTKQPSYFSFDFLLSLSFFAYIGIYVAASMRTLYAYRRHVKNNKLANWQLRVLGLFCIFLGSHLLYFLLQPSGVLQIPQFNMISMLIMTFVIQSIAYGFFANSDMFSNNKSFDLNNLQQQQIDEQRIIDQFEKEKVYLEDTLNLADFALSLSLSKKYVSELINQRLGSSFKDLVSNYRVKEAQEIMQRDLDKSKKLIDIAFESGFNNKVTFYRSFKKYIGQSPSKYYNSLKQDLQKISNRE